MLISQCPLLALCLRPGFNQDGQAAFIDVEATIDTHTKPIGTTFLRQTLKHQDCTVQQYDVGSIQVQTANGELVLDARLNADNSVMELFCTQRVRSQRLIVRYRAFPLVGSEVCGPQVSLRQENGGLSGAGMGFLLDFAEDGTDYTIRVEWDLRAAPKGTRAVSTWGEDNIVTFREKPYILREAFFMVGPIESYPSKPSADFGMYWLSQPPFDAVAIGRRVESLLPRICSLFDDPNPLFRVFTRRNNYRCNSGMGLYRAFVFAWNTIHEAKIDYTEFTVHEMIHNWARLEMSNPPTHQDLENIWFGEGIADYYAQTLPYRYGLVDEQTFVRTINDRISAYYTNPVRSTPNAEVPEKFWTAGRYNRIPYQRGFMYFVRLAYQLYRCGRRSLDDVIREMVSRRLHSIPHGIDVWLQLVQTELGSIARRDFQRMAAAEPIYLDPECMEIFFPDSALALVRCDQEELSLGFPESCLSVPRVVRCLDPQSRAARAGVREGDHITDHFSSMMEVEVWSSCFTMTVVRHGEQVTLAWWPRTWRKVESYQFRRRPRQAGKTSRSGAVVP